MNNNEYKFTVLMPIYNRDDLYELFGRAVESVFSNSILPEELLLIIDGPLDERFSKKVLEYELKYKIRKIQLPENVGLARALNLGLNEVRTEWVMRADGDDFNSPDRFKEQLKYIKQGYDLVGGAIKEVDEHGNTIAIKSPPCDHSEIMSYSKYRNPFNHMTVAFGTELVRSVGGYPDLFLKEDYALWALLLNNRAKVANTKKILVEATTGARMYADRGGFKYVASEIKLQRHLVRCGIKGCALAIFTGLLRSTVFLIPASLRGLFYRTFLRQRA